MGRVLVVLTYLLCTVVVRGQSLPHYKLTVLPSYLDSMQKYIDDEIYCPATLEVEGIVYNVNVKYKGSTSLSYPKKSWGVNMGGDNNYFGVSRLNFHADYKDHSSMRNYLILRLFEFLGIKSPQVQHVTLELNGIPIGLYTQVEQINKDFLQRNAFAPVELYKANNHAGLMAPLVIEKYYSRVWSDELGTDRSLTELKKYLNKCLYLPKNEFDNQIESLVNVDNFITFFAVHFVFVDLDNFTKNIFLNKNSNSLKYEFIPWDNEGSFGNSAIGVFDSTLVKYNLSDSYTPEYQVVFNRLMENPLFVSKFRTEVTRVLTQGYSFLDTLSTNTYNRIKPSVYADLRKEAGNSDFEQSILQLKWFMAARKDFLLHAYIPIHYPLSNYYCSNSYPTQGNSNITFRVKSSAKQRVNMFFCDSVNFTKPGQPFKFSRLELFDDGLHDDLLANDLVYGNIKNTSEFVSSIVPYAYTGDVNSYPENGIFYLDYYASKSLAINKANTMGNISEYIKFGGAYRFNGKSIITLYNTSELYSLDLSYYHLRTLHSYEDFMFEKGTVLAPNETIFVAPAKLVSNYFFPQSKAYNELYFNINTSDSVFLYTSFLTPVIAAQIQDVNLLEAERIPVVLNEINFSSSIFKPAGDWVELYNASNKNVDMTGWTFCDKSNCYNFPSNCIINQNGYLVIAEKLNAFKNAYPTVQNVVGDTGFGLSSAGEYILLYDNLGQLIDSVNYQFNAPWPSFNALGTGSTLELYNAFVDNNDGANWYVDNSKSGSPGVENYFMNSSVIEQVNSVRIFPNPAKDYVYVYNLSYGAEIKISTTQGVELLHQFVEDNNYIRINIAGWRAGVYLIKVTINNQIFTNKLLVK